jgi:hypothetical protein
MAILVMSEEFARQTDVWRMLERNFDVIEFLGMDNRSRTYRIQSDEVPKEDIEVCPYVMNLRGIEPFIVYIEVQTPHK